jgi:hypothetical protein
MAITKAQTKRNLQFRSSLTNRLTVLFNPFRNHNYKSYVNAQIAPHQKNLDSIWGKFENTSDAFESVKGKSFDELGLINRINPRNYKTDSERIVAQMTANTLEVTRRAVESVMHTIRRSRSVMSLLEIHRLNWLGEVKEGFDNRFNKMIDKMCKSITPKGNYFRIEIEELSNSWNEFEVLIKVEDTTFHARAIWVNGTQMVSHYRFVTTTRKTK